MNSNDTDGMLMLGLKELLASRIRTKAEADGKKPAEWAQGVLLEALGDPPSGRRVMSAESLRVTFS